MNKVQLHAFITHHYKGCGKCTGTAEAKTINNVSQVFYGNLTVTLDLSLRMKMKAILKLRAGVHMRTPICYCGYGFTRKSTMLLIMLFRRQSGACFCLIGVRNKKWG